MRLSDLRANDGLITNLLNNDSANVELMMKGIPYFVLAPIETCFVIWFLIRKVDLEFLAGVLFLFSFIPIQLILGKLINIVK